MKKCFCAVMLFFMAACLALFPLAAFADEEVPAVQEETDFQGYENYDGYDDFDPAETDIPLTDPNGLPTDTTPETTTASPLTTAAHDPCELSAYDVGGEWELSMTIGSISSKWVDKLQELFGDAVTKYYDDSTTISVTSYAVIAPISEDIAVLQIYEGTYDEPTEYYSTYRGYFKNNKLHVYRTGGHFSEGDDAIEVSFDELELEFFRDDNFIVCDNIYQHDTFMITAKLGFNGVKTSDRIPPGIELDGSLLQIVKDKVALATAGEDGGTELPAVIVVGAASAAAAAGAAGAASGAGSSPDNTDYDDDRKKSSSFRMYINKDFGNILKKNGKAVAVYARIAEIKPSGEEIERDDLTALISPYSSDNSLEVSDAGMVEGYKAAWVKVPENCESTEGTVSFYYFGAGGSFTENVIFDIAVPQIKFTQPNIALPALMEEEVPLEFTVEGFDDLSKVEISVELPENSSYEVTLKKAEDYENTYIAVIKDINLKKGVPGTYDITNLQIRAEEGDFSVYGDMPIYRVTEGIFISTKAINCYPVLKKGAARGEGGVYPCSAYQSAVTESDAWLMYVDMEKHEVIRSSVSPKISFSLKNKPDIETMDYDEWSEATDQKLDFESLGLKMYVSERSDGISTCKFYCTKGYLKTPSRFSIYLTAEFETMIGGEMRKFECTKQVLLRSQPRRSFLGPEENMARYDKPDELYKQKLETIMDYVDKNYLHNEFLWEYTQAWNHYIGYSYDYGYDTEFIDFLYEIFKQRRYDRDLAPLVKAQEIANRYAERFSYWDAVMDKYHSTNSTIPGIAGRIVCDVLTGGWMEAVFIPMDVMAAIHDYESKTHVEDQTTCGKIVAGSVPVIIAAAFFVGGKTLGWIGAKTGLTKALCTAIKGTGEELKSLGKYVYKKIAPKSKAFTERMSKAIGLDIEKVKLFDPRKFFNRWNNTVNNSKLTSENAKRAVIEKMKLFRVNPSELDDILLALGDDAASLRGAATVEKFAKQVKLYNKGKIPITDLKKYILEIMNDPQAIEQLYQHTGEGAKNLRSVYNFVQKNFIYSPTENKAIELLSKNLPKGTKLRFKNISGKSKLALESGDAIGHDLDVTVEKYVNGKWVALEQSEVKAAYHTAFCETNGIKFGNIEEAISKSESFQQHVCQSLEDMEFYPEVQKLLDPNHIDEAFSESVVDRVKETFKYKAGHLYEEAEKIMKRFSMDEKIVIEKEMREYLESHAKTGAVKAFDSLSKETQEYMTAIALKKEAVRSGFKGYGLLSSKNNAAMSKGCGDVIAKETHELAQAANLVNEHGSEHVSLFKFESLLKDYHTTYEGFTSAMTENVGQVSQNLSQASFSLRF